MYKRIATSLSILAIGAGLPLAAIGLANADTSTATAIPRSVFKTERQDAVASVLGTTTTQVKAAFKDKTFATLLSNDGLTKQTFHQKVKAELISDLEAKGYSQSEITTAMKHAHHHHEHMMKSTAQN